MDPSNANIYTREQAEALGLDFDELVPMSEDDGLAEIRKRIEESRKRLEESVAAALTPGDTEQ